MYKSQMKTILITFFDIEGIVPFEFIQQDKQLTKLIILKCWSGYVKLCIGKGLKFGPTIEFSIMTVLQFTRHHLSSSFWPKSRLLKWKPTLFPWF